MKKILFLLSCTWSITAFATTNCHQLDKNDPQIIELDTIVKQFIKNKDEAKLQIQVGSWYKTNQTYVNNICLGYPIKDENYHRNNLIHHKNYDVFIHTMNPYGHTALHGHGLNEVDIIAVDKGLTSINFKANESDTTTERQLVTLAQQGTHKAAEQHATAEKELDEDMIHFVYNSTNKSIRFLEVYVDEPQHLPIYFPVLASKTNQFIIFYPSKYGYQINVNLFSQMRADSSVIQQSKTCSDLQQYLNKVADVSTNKFVLTNSDNVLTNSSALNKFCDTANTASVFNLMYNKKSNIYLIDQSL